MAEPKHYPECEKLAAASPRSQTVREFLEWLSNSDMEIGEYGTNDSFFPIGHRNEIIMARFLGIDMAKIEEEIEQMLKDIRTSDKL